MAATDSPKRTSGTSGLAWIVVLAIAVLGLLPIIVSAFSQNNTNITVDGDQATYSQWHDEDRR